MTAHREGYRRVMATGKSRYRYGDLLAVLGLRKDGAQISLEFTIPTLRDGEGRIDGMAVIMRDVIKRFAERLALKQQIAAATAR